MWSLSWAKRRTRGNTTARPRMPEDIRSVLFAADADYLDAVLIQIARDHGNVADYLRKEFGVDDAMQSAVRAALLSDGDVFSGHGAKQGRLVVTQHFEWRGKFDNLELNALHAEAFAHAILEIDWANQVEAHSLGWVTARDAGDLIGFVNVAWDGAIHAFILDTIVSINRRGQGIGTQLIAVAATEARAAGCTWLHVDFDDGLDRFYLDACRFRSTGAGLMEL